MSQSTSPVCIVTGVGAGTGAAVCRRFAREGYRVAMLARSAASLAEIGAVIPGTVPFPTDVTDEPALRATLQRVRSELGPASVLVHNAGNASFGGIPHVLPPAETLKYIREGYEVYADLVARGSHDFRPYLQRSLAGLIDPSRSLPEVEGGTIADATRYVKHATDDGTKQPEGSMAWLADFLPEH